MPTPAETRRFYRAGILALDPQAFGLEFLIAAAARAAEPFELAGDGKVAVVHVCGPLVHGDPHFDSYADIVKRGAAAFASEAHTVALKIDSPGGDVYGAFDTPRTLRAMAEAAGKRLVSYSEARMQSAGYALACAGERVVCSSVASVGSIGVIVAHADVTGADKAMGVRFEVFTSGERKADGNPHIPLSDESRAAIQRSIDDTAAVFFALVHDRRAGLDAKPLQGASWVGGAAVAAGVVDDVMSWDSFVAELVANPPGAMVSKASSETEDSRMADKDDKKDSEARKALAKAAADGDEKAKRALAAYDADEKKSAESDEPEKKDDDEKAKKAESDEPKKDDPPKDDEKPKGAAASAAELGLAARVAELEARETARLATAAATERTQLLASRPDLPKSLIDTLKAETPEKIKAIFDSIPKAGNPLAPPTSLATGRAPAGAANDPDRAALDRAFGVRETLPVVEHVGTTSVFRPLSLADQAKARTKGNAQ